MERCRKCLFYTQGLKNVFLLRGLGMGIAGWMWDGWIFFCARFGKFKRCKPVCIITTCKRITADLVRLWSLVHEQLYGIKDLRFDIGSNL